MLLASVQPAGAIRMMTEELAVLANGKEKT